MVKHYTKEEREMIKNRVDMVYIAKKLGLRHQEKNLYHCSEKSKHSRGDENASLYIDTGFNTFVCRVCNCRPNGEPGRWEGNVIDLVKDMLKITDDEALEYLENAMKEQNEFRRKEKMGQIGKEELDNMYIARILANDSVHDFAPLYFKFYMPLVELTSYPEVLSRIDKWGISNEVFDHVGAKYFNEKAMEKYREIWIGTKEKKGKYADIELLRDAGLTDNSDEHLFLFINYPIIIPFKMGDYIVNVSGMDERGDIINACNHIPTLFNYHMLQKLSKGDSVVLVDSLKEMLSYFELKKMSKEPFGLDSKGKLEAVVCPNNIKNNPGGKDGFPGQWYKLFKDKNVKVIMSEITYNGTFLNAFKQDLIKIGALSVNNIYLGKEKADSLNDYILHKKGRRK